MLSNVIQNALNDQINLELYSSYQYLAMSAYCEHLNFRGCAKWLRLQSEEERNHAMKLYDFLTARNCLVQLKPIAAPPCEYSSVIEVFEKALESEESVSQRIDALYELAFTEKAFAALVELEWFISEQVEEERTAREIVAKFVLVKDDPSAILDMDRELGTRNAADVPAVAGE